MTTKSARLFYQLLGGFLGFITSLIFAIIISHDPLLEQTTLDSGYDIFLLLMHCYFDALFDADSFAVMILLPVLGHGITSVFIRALDYIDDKHIFYHE